MEDLGLIPAIQNPIFLSNRERNNTCELAKNMKNIEKRQFDNRNDMCADHKRETHKIDLEMRTGGENRSCSFVESRLNITSTSSARA